MIKNVLRIFTLLAAMTIVYFGFEKLGLNIPVINLQTTNAPSLIKTEWTEEKVLMMINDYRQKKGLGVLTPNEKLSMAAKARLAVLMQYEDSLGEITGLTREDAVEMVGYNYSWIGDLAVLGFFRSNDLTAFWTTQENSRQTLEEPNLKEAGIAVVTGGETMSIYVLLGAPGKVKKATTRPSSPASASWGGPDLWVAVNNRRVEFGVNPLRQKDELCTIAAIRLNQILDLGELDAHAGFEPTLNREDLKWISEKYNISEFLVSGYSTPQESVAAWENTLGHKKLLSGGEYVWGCIYAQNKFGVAIAAY